MGSCFFHFTGFVVADKRAWICKGLGLIVGWRVSYNVILNVSIVFCIHFVFTRACSSIHSENLASQVCFGCLCSYGLVCNSIHVARGKTKHTVFSKGSRLAFTTMSNYVKWAKCKVTTGMNLCNPPELRHYGCHSRMEVLSKTTSSYFLHLPNLTWHMELVKSNSKCRI